MNNFWGEPDDEPLPTWMDPNTYRNKPAAQGRRGKTVAQMAEEALKQPPVPIIIPEPKIEE